MVNAWLNGDGMPMPSWRWLIFVLDFIGAVSDADKVKSFTKPPNGSVCCCVLNVFTCVNHNCNCVFPIVGIHRVYSRIPHVA